MSPEKRHMEIYRVCLLKIYDQDGIRLWRERQKILKQSTASYSLLAGEFHRDKNIMFTKSQGCFAKRLYGVASLLLPVLWWCGNVSKKCSKRYVTSGGNWCGSSHSSIWRFRRPFLSVFILSRFPCKLTSFSSIFDLCAQAFALFFGFFFELSPSRKLARKMTTRHKSNLDEEGQRPDCVWQGMSTSILPHKVQWEC